MRAFTLVRQRPRRVGLAVVAVAIGRAQLGDDDETVGHAGWHRPISISRSKAQAYSVENGRGEVVIAMTMIAGPAGISPA